MIGSDLKYLGKARGYELYTCGRLSFMVFSSKVRKKNRYSNFINITTVNKSVSFNVGTDKKIGNTGLAEVLTEHKDKIFMCIFE